MLTFKHWRKIPIHLRTKHPRQGPVHGKMLYIRSCASNVNTREEFPSGILGKWSRSCFQIRTHLDQHENQVRTTMSSPTRMYFKIKIQSNSRKSTHQVVLVTRIHPIDQKYNPINENQHTQVCSHLSHNSRQQLSCYSQIMQHSEEHFEKDKLENPSNKF